MGPIGAKRGIATGLRVPAGPRRLRTTDTRRRRASVARQAVILRLTFRFGSAHNILSGYGFDSIAEVAVDCILDMHSVWRNGNTSYFGV